MGGPGHRTQIRSLHRSRLPRLLPESSGQCQSDHGVRALDLPYHILQSHGYRQTQGYSGGIHQQPQPEHQRAGAAGNRQEAWRPGMKRLRYSGFSI